MIFTNKELNQFLNSLDNDQRLIISFKKINYMVVSRIAKDFKCFLNKAFDDLNIRYVSDGIHIANIKTWDNFYVISLSHNNPKKFEKDQKPFLKVMINLKANI